MSRSTRLVSEFLILLVTCSIALQTRADDLVYDSFNDAAFITNFIEIGKFSPPGIIDIQGKQIFVPTDTGFLTTVKIRRINHMDTLPDYGPLQIELCKVIGGASLGVVNVDRLDVPALTTTGTLDSKITVDFSALNIVLEAGIQYEIVLRLATPQTSDIGFFGYQLWYVENLFGFESGERSLDGGVTWGPFPSTMELQVNVTTPTEVAYDNFEASNLTGGPIEGIGENKNSGNVVDYQLLQLFTPDLSGVINSISVGQIYQGTDFGALQLEIREANAGPSVAVVDIPYADVPSTIDTLNVDFTSLDAAIEAGTPYELVARMTTPVAGSDTPPGYFIKMKLDNFDVVDSLGRSDNGGSSFGFDPTNFILLKVRVDPPCGFLNPSFETGDFSSWITQDLSQPHSPLRVTGAGDTAPFNFVGWLSDPSDGVFTAFHGFAQVPFGTGTPLIHVAQVVVINEPMLHFDWRAGWIESGGTEDRTFDVVIRPAGGGAELLRTNILTAPAAITNTDTGQTSSTVNLSSFSGQTVMVSFEWNLPIGSNGPGQFQLDNVCLKPNPAVQPVGNGIDPRLKLWDSRSGNASYDVDIAIPDAINKVEQTNTSPLIGSFEYGNGVYYVPSSTNADLTPLSIVDPKTGALLDTITMVFPPEGVGINSVEFVGSILYAGMKSTQNKPLTSSLVTIDTTSGVVTHIGAMGISEPTGGLAYYAGTMYTVNAGATPATLYAVDLTTGAATPIAPVIDAATGGAINLTGLEYGADGVLYGLGRGSNLGTDPLNDVLYSIDTATGFAFNLGRMLSLDDGTNRISTAITSAPIDPELKLLQSNNARDIWDLDVHTPDVSNAVTYPAISSAIPGFEYGLGAYYAANRAIAFPPFPPTDLYVLEPDTGVLLNTITMTFPAGGDVITSLEFVGSTLYGGFTTVGIASPASLVTIDLNTGNVALIGAMGFNGGPGGLAYDGTTMYTVNAASGNAFLYTVNLATGLATAIGPVLDSSGGSVILTGLEFGNDGLLYALGNEILDGNRLYIIDPATGAATRLGSLPGLSANPGNGATSLTSIPTDCGFFNPSFETGTFFGWITQDLITPFFTPLTVNTGGDNSFGWPWASAPTDGLFTAYHGFDGDGATSGIPIALAQDVTIIEPILEFDWRAAWNFFSGTQDRTFDVVIRPAGGGAELDRFNILTAPSGTLNNDTGQTTSTVNLSAFLNQTVRVEFEWFIPEDFTGPAQFQFDNVCLKPNACPADLNGDTVVSGSDLLILLGGWGGPGVGDLDSNGTTNGTDLLLLLGSWGPCS